MEDQENKIRDILMNMISRYKQDTATYQTKVVHMEQPLVATAEQMIRAFYGVEHLPGLYVKSQGHTDYDHLVNTLLSGEPIDIHGSKVPASCIIPAQIITQQYVNDQQWTITIPPHAFNNMRLIKLADAQMPHYPYRYMILLQSAHKPNKAYPLGVTINSNTVIFYKCSKWLQNYKWTIQVGDAGRNILQQYDQYYNAYDDQHLPGPIVLQYNSKMV